MSYTGHLLNAGIDTARETFVKFLRAFKLKMAGTNAIVYPLVDPTQAAVAKTSNYTVLASQLGTTFTNTGGSGTVVFTLPPVADSKGGVLRFVGKISQVMSVDVTGTELLYLDGVATAGYKITITGTGHFADLYCNGSAWMVINRSSAVSLVA